MVEVNQGLYKYAQITVALVKLKNQDDKSNISDKNLELIKY
jgi:hypothetical protein